MENNEKGDNAMNYNEIPGDDEELYVSPEECKAWAQKIRSNKKHAYWGGQFDEENIPMLEESDRAVRFVNMMEAGFASGKGCNLKGWITTYEAEKVQIIKEQTGDAEYGKGPDARKSSNLVEGNRSRGVSEDVDNHNTGIGYGYKEVKSGSGYRIEDGGGEQGSGFSDSLSQNKPIPTSDKYTPKLG